MSGSTYQKTHTLFLNKDIIPDSVLVVVKIIVVVRVELVHFDSDDRKIRGVASEKCVVVCAFVVLSATVAYGEYRTHRDEKGCYDDDDGEGDFHGTDFRTGVFLLLRFFR